MNPNKTRRDAQTRPPEVASHTPGPWENYGSEVRKAIKWGYTPLADVLHGPNDFDAWVPFDEAQANARLIAAAPDLLAACEALQWTMRRFDPVFGGDGSRNYCPLCEGCELDGHRSGCIAGAAIQKARGVAP